ncbi:MAG TPA: hypothetical protein VII06_18160 [Chloroflexota bacterium]
MRSSGYVVGRWVLVLALAVLGVWPAARAAAQDECRMPPDDELDAGAALESVMLVLHGLWAVPPELDQGRAYGDPGNCPGGRRDGFRGVDIMGWALEVSGPARPELCSPNDPPIMELPVRNTRCVEDSTTVASRNARVTYPELVSRAPFPLLLPTSLPDGLAPHWTTLRVTDRREGTGAPRQYGTIVRYLGASDDRWLLLLQDTGEAPAPWLDGLRASMPSVEVRETEASVLDTLPDYDGEGTGLLWDEDGLRVALFGTYSADELTAIAEALVLHPPAAVPPE